jgi:hypothetical protein
MRITGVELSSDNYNLFTFNLNAVRQSDKYLLKAIVGLDADHLVSRFYGTGKVSRRRYYNFNMMPREVVVRIVLNPNYEINEDFSQLRDELYRIISSSRSGVVNLLFTAGADAVSRIDGFVTKFEVAHNSKVPELQVTILCDDPMLRGYNPVELETADFNTVNPVIMADTISTAPHGMTIDVEFTTTVPSFTVRDSLTPDWTFTVTPDGGFLSGDRLVLSSEVGQKELTQIRGATVIPLLDKITPDSLWPIMFPGNNTFYFNQLGSFDWNLVKYYTAFWGV